MRENGARWRITNPGYVKRYDRCLSLVAKAVMEFLPANLKPIDDDTAFDIARAIHRALKPEGFLTDKAIGLVFMAEPIKLRANDSPENKPEHILHALIDTDFIVIERRNRKREIDTAIC
jgi:hypothetical protein